MIYIFDMDGTLIDSMSTFGGAITKFLDELGIDYPDDLIRTVTPLGFAGTVKYLKESFGLALTDGEILNALGSNMLDGYLHTIPAKGGVRDKLEKLKAEGHTLAVLTASPHVTLDPCLKRLGIDGLFTKIWSSDDFGKQKTDPSIYLDAVKALGGEAGGAIFVDDNVEAVKAAKKAGLTAYGIYDKSGEAFIHEMKEVADRYLYNFSEI